MSKRYVIKIGSSLLTNENGTLNSSYLERLVKSLSIARDNDIEILIVTSGAIATGIGKLNIPFTAKNIREKQALASIGQTALVNAYEKEFSKYNYMTAQILLTRRDIQERHHYLNVRNTILTLLDKKVVPIINENDTVSVEEIQFGDNDTLSALVAAKVDAHYLIILTDIDGLYDKDPRTSKDANLVKVVANINEEHYTYAGKEGTVRGTGGMITKLSAAKMAVSAGTTVIIANGNNEEVLNNIFKKDDFGTKFIPDKDIMSHRKRWLAFNAEVKGIILIDKGAVKALVENGKSLLPAGINEVQGIFDVGDVISIKDCTSKKEIARGITAYSSKDIEKIKQCKTCDIKEILGENYYDEVVHRDNMVII